MLLERERHLSDLEALLAEVRSTSAGRLVARRRRGRRRQDGAAARVLRRAGPGGARALGRLCAAAHAAPARPARRRRRGDSAASSRSSSRAPRGRTRLRRRCSRELRRREPTRAGARGRPLGRRGDARRADACSLRESTRRPALVLAQLPRRRARPRRAAARRARRARAAARAAQGSSRSRRRRSPSSPQPHGVDARGASPQHRRQPVLRHGGARRRRRADARTPCATRCSPAPRVCPRRRADLLDAVAIVPGQVELWLLEALAGEPRPTSTSAWPPACCAAGPRARRVPARARAAGDRGGDRRRTAGSRCTARRSPRWGSAAGDADPARLAHHADAAGDADAVLRWAPRAAERAAASGAHREAAAQYARALRFAGALAARGARRRCWHAARARVLL